MSQAQLPLLRLATALSVAQVLLELLLGAAALVLAVLWAQGDQQTLMAPQQSRR